MKKFKIIILILLLTAGVSIDSSANLRIHFAFGDSPAINDCAGRGICFYINFRTLADNFNVNDLGDNMGIAEIEIVNDELKMDIIYDNSEDRFNPEFNVAQSIELDAAICKLLGYNDVIILAGRYRLNYSRFQLGSVTIPVEVR